MTDLDYWRSLSPKSFTGKLLDFAEEHANVLPEQAYIQLMNATKVLHERHAGDDDHAIDAAFESDDEEDVSSEVNSIERVASIIVRLNAEKQTILAKKKKYNDFKIYKNVTQKIREEAILTLAHRGYGVQLPFGTFESLRRHCAIDVPEDEREQFYAEYMHYRNEQITTYRDHILGLLDYIEDRLQYFTHCYNKLMV